MIAFLQKFAVELQAIFLDASFYIVFGFIVAACIQVFLPMQTVARLLGKGRVRPIFMASLLGIPLPLCSCAVLPTGLALRRRGASPGATASFLISTPESDVDAIVLTWGLLGPVMAVWRPIAAFVTAIAAGFAADFWVKDPPPAGEASTPGHEGHHHDAFEKEVASPASAEPRRRIVDRLRAGFWPAFRELFDETSHWIFAGLVISALISTLLPSELVLRYLSEGPLPLVVMLLIGVPLYICASASTPIAASLVLKGLSPGAALVFLLAGPATNLGSLGVLGRAFGGRFLAVYIGSISFFALAFGALLDWTMKRMNWTAKATLGAAADLPVWLAWPAALVLLVLLVASFRRVKPPKEFRDVGNFVGRLLGITWSPRVFGRIAAAAGLLAYASTCFVIVPPGRQGLVRRFGAPHGTPRTEGLHFKLPFPIDRAEIIHSEAVQRVEIGFRTPTGEQESNWLAPEGQARNFDEEALYLTGDENIVDTKATLQYRVVDPMRYRYGFNAPEATLQAQAIAELLDVLAGIPIDGYYTSTRREVEKRVEEGIRRRAQEVNLGIEVVHFSILSVHAPPEVHAAFRDVASSQEDKQREIDIAFRYLDETVNLARGEAAARVEGAASDSGTSVLRAEGDSKSLLARVEAARVHRSGTRKRLYLETMEEVLSRGTKILRPGWKGSGSMDLWISGKGGSPVPAKSVIAEERQSSGASSGGEGGGQGGEE